MEIDSRKTEALPFLPPENPSFPLPSLSLSFHGRYRLPEVKKACLLQAFCYSTCPRSFRTSSGHVHKSNKCVLSKINVVKYCYTIMPVRRMDRYCENTSMRCLPKRSLTSNGVREILTIILQFFKTRLTLSRFSRNFSCMIGRKSLVL